VRASIRKSNHALIYNEELKKIRFQMLNAHNKNRPVKYLECLKMAANIDIYWKTNKFTLLFGDQLH